MKRTGHVLARLPDYLVGGLGKAEITRIEQHLKTCKSCHDEYSTLTTMWAKLGLLPDEAPSQQLRARFYADLNEYKRAHERQRQPEQRWVDRFNAVLWHLWPRQPVLQLGVAVLFLMAGYVIGFRIDGGRQPWREWRCRPTPCGSSEHAETCNNVAPEDRVGKRQNSGSKLDRTHGSP